MENIEKSFFNKSLLFILESPSKAKTISYILKKINIRKFKIVATRGHIKDLPKNNLGFKIEKDKIVPFFNFLPGKKRIIDYIKKLLGQYNYVILATDPDREGEAIAFHVYSELSNGLASNFKENSQQKLNFKRAFINEITLNGVKKGLENLSEINLSMVESQLARRIIDRVIGYKISPVLWRSFKIKGLSAGRVQTATLKILVQREKEIENFKPKKYFTIKINFKINEYNLSAYLYGKNGDLFKVFNKEEVKNLENSFLKKIVGKLFEFEMNEGVKEIIPPDPLKTSTLQQEAAKIGIPNSLTMKIAQKLYEGVFIGKEKRGLITYHRTDSVRVSQEGIELAKKILGNVRVYSRKNKSAFDAHEAIRITYPFSLSLLRKYLSDEEFKIYELIYRRFLASLYLPCEYAYNEIICCLSQDFYIKYQAGKVLKEGFLKILPQEIEKYKIFKNTFVDCSERFLKIIDYEIEENHTKPPPRYTLSSIIRKMEEVGIGRPSTYASTIETLKKRKYIQVKKGVIVVTELGKKVLEFLDKGYSDLLDVEFTALMENFLDEIEASDISTAKKFCYQKIWEIYQRLRN